MKLGRKIGRNPALAQFIELEILPGDEVADDQLADVIASNIASYGHPTATAPRGGTRTHGRSWTRMAPSEGSTGFASSTHRSCPLVPSVAINPTTIMIAERIAKVIYGSEAR